MKKIKTTFKVILVYFVVCQMGYADVLSSFNFEPGLIGKTISTTATPYAPAPVPKLESRPVEKPTINPEAKKIFFVLNGVKIKGNTAFSAAELQTVFKPWLRRKISVAKLQSLVQEISDKYQKAGYFLSKAILPPQEIDKGIVQVTVIEGFISDIKVQGLKRNDLVKYLEKYAHKIKEQRPIKLKDLEHQLLLLNDIPGFAIKSVLAPDPKVPFGSMLTLVAEYTSVQASLMQDNYQTRYLGPDETTLVAALNSDFIAGSTWYTRVLNADEHRNLEYYELRRDQTIGSSGLVFSLDSYVTKTHPMFTLTPLKIYGRSFDGTATLSYPLIRTKKRNLRIFGQFEYMDNMSTALGEQLYIDRIRDVSISAQYNDLLWKGEDIVNLIVYRGLPILNGGGTGFRSRTGAVPQFLRIVGVASRNQPLYDRFSAFALITGQHSNHILPAAETFFFGGPYIGRGYDWAQFIGDKGVAGKAEFRVNTATGWPFLSQIQTYAFFDAGKVWSLIRGVPPISGASAGIGARGILMKNVTADGFFGKPLTTPNATQIILGHSGHAFLGYFQVTASFQ